MRDCSKSFPGVRALSGVSMTVTAGEVRALLGENGAGKSTLMNMLDGVFADYDGQILVDGRPVSVRSPRAAQELGISMIHQELHLVPELSIAENIFLGREPRTPWGTVDRARMRRDAAELLAQLDLDVPPTRLIRLCRLAEQQLIEVAKALSLEATILIMDEPTSALADAEIRQLFNVIRRLSASGVAVIYISHRLEELFEIASSVTVLRDGELIGTRSMAGVSSAELIRMMVGRPLKEFFVKDEPAGETREDCLRVEGLSLEGDRGAGRRSLHDVSFRVRCGEVVGLAGLMGAGRTEVLETIFGVHPDPGRQPARVPRGRRARVRGRQPDAAAPRHRHRGLLRGRLVLQPGSVHRSAERQPGARGRQLRLPVRLHGHLPADARGRGAVLVLAALRHRARAGRRRPGRLQLHRLLVRAGPLRAAAVRHARRRRPASERAHGYASTSPGDRSVLTSTFEGDFDGDPVTDDLRATSAPVRFTLRLDRRNRGVTLRRRSDQADAYQSARVLVDGRDAGVWLEPLHNGDHRWLEDSFQIPAGLTAGHRETRITLAPVAGSPPWSVARYTAFSRVAGFTDRRAPSQVTGLTAQGGRTDTVSLSWRPATDDVGVASYEVYGSQRPDFRLGPATLLGRTGTTSFTHEDGLGETWYYRVRAVDGAGNAGTASSRASATTGSVLDIEAESLLPAADATAPAVSQGSCCGIRWSGDAQLWFQATGAPNHFTVSFDMPRTGTYDLSAVLTKAPDYGISTLAVDGRKVGSPFDGYNAGGVAVQRAAYGPVALASGRRTLTLTVTGRNPAAAGWFAGLDLIELELTS